MTAEVPATGYPVVLVSAHPMYVRDLEPGQVFVLQAGERLMLDTGRLPRRLWGRYVSGVSIVDISHRLVSVQFSVSAADRSSQEVKVTFACAVTDPITVVEKSIDARKSLLRYLQSSPPVHEAAATAQEAGTLSARLQAHVALQPPVIPGVRVELTSIDVQIPHAAQIREHRMAELLELRQRLEQHLQREEELRLARYAETGGSDEQLELLRAYASGRIDATLLGHMMAADMPPDEPRRTLVANLPGRAGTGTEISLLVRVIGEGSKFAGGERAGLVAFSAPPEGAGLTIVVETAAGLRVLESAQQKLTVPAKGDSAPVRFPLWTVEPGLHWVRVTAWLGGTFAGELDLQVAVGADIAQPDSPRHCQTPLPELNPVTGEATLQVCLINGQYMFQLLTPDNVFDMVPGEQLTADPAEAVSRVRAGLRQLAAGSSDYSASNARGLLENLGIGLWDSMIPDLIKEQFWAQHSHITAFTIASAYDIVPWELLYPLGRGHDNGFLAEQFPVLRRVHGQHRSLVLDTTDACFVVPPQSPANAVTEIEALRRILRTRADRTDTIGELANLQRLIDSGETGLLHFVCHNTFDAAGGRIRMTGGSFIPALLNRAADHGLLRRRNPLVFLNACTSAVSVPEYTTTMGWARQFMRAGAGAFLGTAWDVRSRTAQGFAESFYTALEGGATLGQSTLQARRAVCGDGSDPTWLAYIIYGNPGARAFPVATRGVDT